MIKKYLAAALALTMCVCAFTACAKDSDSSSSSKSSSSSSKADSSSASSEVMTPGSDLIDNGETAEATVPDPALVIDGEEQDISNLVVCTIDGYDVDFDMFRYYYYYTLNRYQSSYGATIDTIKETEGGFELFLEDVVTSLKQEMVAKELAEENDIALDDADLKSVQEQIDSAKANYDTDEAFQDELKKSYLTPELFETMLKNAALYQKVHDTLFINEGKYATTKEDFKTIVQDPEQFCREIHIMIPYYSQAELDDSTAESYDTMSLSEKVYAKQMAFYQLDEDAQQKAKDKAKELAESLLKEAQETDDFSKLVEKEGYDVGLEDATNGYYISKGSTGYPESLVEAAFALAEDEVSSELTVDETYGYFIIKRLPIDMEYVENNIESMIESYDYPVIEKVYSEYLEKMKVTYFDKWDKITADSVS